jgi:hypothetical protein
MRSEFRSDMHGRTHHNTIPDFRQLKTATNESPRIVTLSDCKYSYPGLGADTKAIRGTAVF